MRKVHCAIALSIALGWSASVVALPQDPKLEIGPARPAQEVGVSLAAAAINIVYFPARFVVTAVTGGIGGLAAWMTGGDKQSAQAIWNSTEGPAFVTPQILEGRESLHFGRLSPASQ